MKGSSLAGLAGAFGFLFFPLLASAADCWLRDGAAPTPTNAIMLCQQGRVYISADGGNTWTPRETQAGVPVRAIAFKDPAHGFVVGDSGLIMATEDGGKTWQQRVNEKKERFTTQNLTTIFALGDLIWAAGFDGVILHSKDSGRTWTKQESATTLTLENIFFLDPSHGWAVGWSGAILRTEDGGNRWQTVTSKAASWSLSWVAFRDLKNGWAVGFNGQLLRSRDGGVTWEAQKSPTNAWLRSIAFDRSNRIWIVTDDQMLLSDDGETWRAVKVDSMLFLRRLLPVGSSLWAIGQMGMIKQSGVGTDWALIDSLVASGSTTETVYKKAPGSN